MATTRPRKIVAKQVINLTKEMNQDVQAKLYSFPKTPGFGIAWLYLIIIYDIKHIIYDIKHCSLRANKRVTHP